MKVVILNTSEHTGGAAVAANRLLKALRKQGVEATMLVRDKSSQDPNVHSINRTWFQQKVNLLRFLWERLVIFLCNRFSRSTLFQVSIANTGTDLSQHPLVQAADIIHLHWINQGFLSLHDLQKLVALDKPIVWTMHDMWPCTGICHHAYTCQRFTSHCHACPFLLSKHLKDLAYRTFEQKRFIGLSNIHLVTVSHWLKQLAQQSALTKGLPTHVIPNVIDTYLFVPNSRLAARHQLNLPLNKKIIVMGAARLNDPIKGIEYLQEALTILTQTEKECELLLFGGIKGDDSFLRRFPIPYYWLGLIHEPSRITQLYAAADVTIVPSKYETFGQTIIEGMACGCPAVTFNNSGQTDIITHQQDGYLANYQDSADLARGIEWVLNHPEPAKLRETCIQKVKEHYSEEVIAGKYLSLYEQIKR